MEGYAGGQEHRDAGPPAGGLGLSQHQIVLLPHEGSIIVEMQNENKPFCLTSLHHPIFQ